MAPAPTAQLGAAIVSEFESVPVDRLSIPAVMLDLPERRRTSVLPWRGQFSPQLIANLLEHFGRDAEVIADPFAGSGTALIEAARQGRSAWGFDVNPAAVYAARTAELMNLPVKKRDGLFRAVGAQLEGSLAPYRPADLFAIRAQGDGLVPIDVMRELVTHRPNRQITTILANSVMQATGPNGTTTTVEAVLRSFSRYSKLCAALPYSRCRLRAEQKDGRSIPLADSAVDLVITSPPYINVFNYHQNYRWAMELMGHRLLTVAKSEIGANRKHRSNRFLTVIQYCLDMRLALIECSRFLKREGILVLVVGRESNVLGRSFENGRALYAIGRLVGFKFESRLERVFVSRYGTRVYEDILIFRNTGAPPSAEPIARGVARWLLERAAQDAGESIRESIDLALRAVGSVDASPGLVDDIYC